ncbi:MAG TPA: hypothetical protein VFQ68_19275 [Streptosporangiaceae bacterium]|nr:hypothetical protein [Streptosporangiaceae bacterium]
MSQIQPGSNRAGNRSMAWSSRPCSAAALSVPAGPAGIANSARHEQHVNGSARRHGYGPESSLVPTVPKAALFAGVSGTRSSVPSSDPALSGLFFPIVTAPGQPRPWCSRHAEPSTRSRSSSRGTGPSAFRQSPAARADAGRHGRAHGTRARSPASAAMTSWTRASGISVISTITRIMNALASSLSRSPLTSRASSRACPAIPAITPAPAFSSSGHSVAWCTGLPFARTCPSLLTCASATATTLQNTTAPPVRIRCVPPMTSADRSASPRSRPFLSGDAASSSGTAIIIPAETGTAHDGTG